MPTHFFPSLAQKIDVLEAGLETISSGRKELLFVLVQEIRGRLAAEKPLRLNFICTHNSRRSQLAQVWAAVAAAKYDVAHVQTYSGGTEATAFNPRAVRALERAGLRVERTQGTNESNPLYLVSFSDRARPVRCFSKVFDAPENPAHDFFAVMTCGEADQDCPVILGAKRIALLFEDPKVADGTDAEVSRYDERSDQIGAELLWVFREVNNRS